LYSTQNNNKKNSQQLFHWADTAYDTQLLSSFGK
jgi:hypothetical protein